MIVNSGICPSFCILDIFTAICYNVDILLEISKVDIGGKVGVYEQRAQNSWILPYFGR